MDSSEPLPISSTFAVRCNTQLGDRVMLVGAPPSLGSWEPTRGVELTTDETAFPVYTSPKVVCPTPGFVEYKFVRITAGGACVWEQGSNRCVWELRGSCVELSCVAVLGWLLT